MADHKTEWRGRSEFSEIAEALGVPTDNIMAMLGEQHVMYTPDLETLDIWGAPVGRDADGILVVGPPNFICTAADFQSEMKTLIDKHMEGR